MVNNRRIRGWSLSIVTLALAAVGLALAHPAGWTVRAQTSTNPNDNFPPFDFSNPFYAENGINVEPGSPFNTAGGRVGIPGHPGAFGLPGPFPNPENANWVAEPGVNTDPTRTDAAHVLQTTGGFDKDANLIYYSIMGTVNDVTFFTMGNQPEPEVIIPPTPDVPIPAGLDAAGSRAFRLAEDFRAVLKPFQFANNPGHFAYRPCGKTLEDDGVGGKPGDPNNPCFVASPAPPNRREDNVFDTKNSYFCQNVLGLWTLAFAMYTEEAYNSDGTFASRDAQAILGPLGDLNQVNLDGTPVFQRIAEIDGLHALGYVKQFTMPRAPHAGAPRYVV